MGEFRARGKVGEMRLQATVIRADGTREELGTIAYWHKSWLRRLVARLRGVGRIRGN